VSSRKQSSCGVRKTESGCGGCGEEKVGLRACIYAVWSVATCDSMRVCKILALGLCCALSEIWLTPPVMAAVPNGNDKKVGSTCA